MLNRGSRLASRRSSAQGDGPSDGDGQFDGSPINPGDPVDIPELGGVEFEPGFDGQAGDDRPDGGGRHHEMTPVDDPEFWRAGTLRRYLSRVDNRSLYTKAAMAAFCGILLAFFSLGFQSSPVDGPTQPVYTLAEEVMTGMPLRVERPTPTSLSSRIMSKASISSPIV